MLAESLDEEDDDAKVEEEMAVDAEDEDDEVKKVIHSTRKLSKLKVETASTKDVDGGYQ